MIKNTLAIALFFVLVACNPAKLVTQSSTLLHITINSGNSILEDETLLFIIENKSSEALTIIYPEKKIIEKNDDGKWRKLSILECPCDAPCQPSPEKIILKEGKKLTLNWDQKESWCAPRSASQIRKTIYKLTGKGSYRMTINIKTENGEEKHFYKHFKIGK